MGVLDDLRQAREDYERGDLRAAFAGWSSADPGALDTRTLVDLANTALLIGDNDSAQAAMRTAFDRHLTDGEFGPAVRCAFYLAIRAGTSGDQAQAGAWAGRAGAILDDHPALGERGYLTFLRVYGHVMAGDFEGAGRLAAEAASIGREHGDPELLALGLVGIGRAGLYSGRVSEAMAAFDEAMLNLAEPEVSPVTAGFVYCSMIEACQEISDFGRAAEWTGVLQRWCERRPGLVAFTGQCAVHRGQLMRARGAWDEALDELAQARRRYVETGAAGAVGVADYETGEVHRLRGAHEAAEAAYQHAGDAGFDPQPGLALLWLAQGRTQASVAAVRRLLAEATDPVHRSRVLPAAVEVLVTADQREEARTLAGELDTLATSFGCPALQAAAAQAAGLVELATDPAGALPYLRKAGSLWSGVEDPYAAARVRVLTGRALAALGDEDSARRELESAERTFASLGATPDASAVRRLLEPGAAPDGLTPREVEVLRLVASGRSNGQIADELVLSEKTVARHLSNIFTKIGVGSRTAAAAYAYERGLA
ncbi:LuxR family transcriptional regulator [Nocardioides guangzhouensis]|uniref:LuxR family transcriptional regulator n=1 Tax=Nocardioides guangzhouensis TaxID=2497878 RepID=A0A4Q4ZGF2_9ACTN|nr:LuxR family transcriptional regulator [Nocardioides guangzhouensis]RYP86825.1 LuxR family transcriptional regulator [Nocardioides guangzhouensis]